MMGFSRIWLAILLVFGVIAVHAGEAPQEMVQQTATKVIAKLTAEKALIEKQPERLYGLINEYILPRFDFDSMSQWVLGKYWRTATPDQRTKFVAEFRTLLVRTYANSLSEYAEQKIDYLPFRGDLKSGDVTVRSQVSQPGGFPVPIEYQLHQRDGEWKVYDVKIDDISLISNYRTTFSAEIRQGGLDKLIAKLNGQNKKSGV